MELKEMLYILSWPMAAFIMLWVDSLLGDWGVFGPCNTILERIILVVSIIAYIILAIVGSFYC